MQTSNFWSGIYNELRRHHSHVHNKRKAKQTEKSTTLLTSIRELKSQEKNFTCRIGERGLCSWESQPTRAETHQQKLPGKWVLWAGRWNAQCIQVWELKTLKGTSARRDPILLWVLSLGPQVLTVNTREKSHHASTSRRGKVATLKYAKSFCS